MFFHPDPSRGATLRRGEPGYEAARRALAWNQRLPARFPDVIVQANDADSLRDARAALAFLDDAPRSPEGLRSPFVPMPLAWMCGEVMRHYPSGHGYAVDNMWMSADVDAVLPHLRTLVEALSPAPSHALWLNWAPPQRTADMPFSLEDAHYLALYGVWKHARDDARHASWAAEHMRAMAHLATGIQLADENLGRRPAPFVAQRHLERLDTIRAARDPQQLFHPWMGRP